MFCINADNDGNDETGHSQSSKGDIMRVFRSELEDKDIVQVNTVSKRPMIEQGISLLNCKPGVVNLRNNLFLSICFIFPRYPLKKKKHSPLTMSLALKQVFNKDRTFRPKRKFEPGTQRFELHKKAQASLNAGLDLKLAVQLPHGEDLSDWVAVHVVDFFNRINLIYGTISESCTEQTCPVMSGGPKYEYRWQDEQKYKKPTALSAPKYMSLLMEWIEVQINNEQIFPTNVGTPFPKSFMQVAKKILSRLFRVFVHVYIHHFDRVSQMGAEAHVNTCYKHFYYFVNEFSLIDQKELEPLVHRRGLWNLQDLKNVCVEEWAKIPPSNACN
ncbi:mps one binder kinase activator-like 2A [Silurus meridionalis]|nr:mps one binder kinase activator-like 2A [Silurus meridionalis]